MRKIASISAVIGVNVLLGAAAMSDASATFTCPPPTVRVCLEPQVIHLRHGVTGVHCGRWGCRADPSMVPVSTAQPPPVILPPTHIITQTPRMNIRIK